MRRDQERKTQKARNQLGGLCILLSERDWALPRAVLGMISKQPWGQQNVIGDYQAVQFPSFIVNIWSGVHTNQMKAPSGGPQGSGRKIGVFRAARWGMSLLLTGNLLPYRDLQAPWDVKAPPQPTCWPPRDQSLRVIGSEWPTLALSKKRSKENREVSVI